MNRSIWTACLLFSVVALLTVMACKGDDDVPVPERGVPSFFEITVFGVPPLEGLLTDEIGLDRNDDHPPETFKRLEPQAGLEYGPQEGRLVVSRGIYTFDISKIEPGSSVQSARLYLFQSDVEGDPYEFLEEIIVDHIDTSMFDELDPALFDGSDLTRDIGTISQDPLPGYKVLDVTAQVQDDVDNDRGRSSFRIRGLKEQLFQLEGNDRAVFTDSLNDLGFIPELDVLYERPRP